MTGKKDSCAAVKGVTASQLRLAGRKSCRSRGKRGSKGSSWKNVAVVGPVACGLPADPWTPWPWLKLKAVFLLLNLPPFLLPTRLLKKMCPSPRIEKLWHDLAEKMCDAERTYARELIVKRARQIWGRLGRKLQGMWGKQYRNDNMSSFYTVRAVKQWKPK